MSSLSSARISGVVYPAFRLVVGFLFACHGAAKLVGVFGGVDGAGGTASVPAWPVWWAGVVELVGGVLVAVGLGTRVAALICSGAMAYAYFVVHQELGALPIENGGETAALYSWLFLLIAALGPGAVAVDNLWRRSRPGGAERNPATSG
ncbi:MAG: DoxX family protein [Pseudonocardiales bacterium]